MMMIPAVLAIQELLEYWSVGVLEYCGIGMLKS